MRRFLLLFVLLDNWLTNLAKKIFPTKWKRTGSCRQCGQCCKEIYLTMTPAQTRSKLFTTLSIKWITWLFGFILIRVDRENNSLVFTCRYLTPQGKCGNYRWRPNVCRNYPLIDYFKEPKLLPGCGYSKIQA